MLKKRWPDDIFPAVKKGVDAPLESRQGDVAVVLDLATVSATYKKKLYRSAPNVREIEATGKIESGSLLVDKHSSGALYGEMDEEEQKIYIITVDSTDEEQTMSEVMKAISRLMEFLSLRYMAGDDRLGQLVK